MAARPEARRGTLANGMDFATWGSGPKTLLYLPGGPGSSIPDGLMARTSQRWFDPFVDSGYAVRYVTRRRHQPRGHTVADMADDVGAMIVDELGGRVDLVLGESFGGMIALHLAARQGDCLDRLAVVVAAAEVSAWGKEVDGRLLAALARSDLAAAGSAFAEYALPGDGTRWLRRLAGPLIARSLFSGKRFPTSDVLVETESELTFDARGALPDIRVPVVLISGDRDRFFPQNIVEETVRLIPDCTLIAYEGKGHLQVASDRRVAHDIVAFVSQR
ncbi:alpha/beta fold hydrolase [Terrabacter sp. GCM10028922]|uniref:alpha/beta fold hydrolase n=1 Tax=Terrabacter sp. GCM10028922 TaxID=3273428 RepID=UPI00361800A6